MHEKTIKRAAARLFLPVCLAGFVSGCQTTPNWYWEKHGASQQDFYVDSGQCRAQAASVPGMALLQVVIVYESCLAGKGWYKVQAPG